MSELRQTATSQPLPGGLRWAWCLLAWIALALGLLGIVLPGLPTTPFILLAAWAASRGSVRLRRWLLAHRAFGPMVRDWERDGAVSRRAKRFASLAMGLCALILLLWLPLLPYVALGWVCMAAVALWLWQRPEPQPMSGTALASGRTEPAEAVAAQPSVAPE